MSPDPDLAAAARVGAQRAAIHLLKAGYEILAGVGAFIEELRKATDGDLAAERPGPQRIVVEGDDDEEV